LGSLQKTDKIVRQEKMHAENKRVT
jgi:hypothetical protein